MLNNKPMAFEVYTIDGNNYFKLRDLASTLNDTDKMFELRWDNIMKALIIKTDEKYTAVGGELAVSNNISRKDAMQASSMVLIDGKEVSITAYTINGNNYFKLRDIGKILDFGIVWDATSNSIGYTQ